MMMFACIIGSIEDAFTPEILELALGISALEPMKTFIHRFGALGVMVPMVSPSAVMLSVVTGVGLGW